MPILEANAFEFFSRSTDQTRRVGMRLGSVLQPGDVVCLDGDLGAGKTTLVQGIAAGWGATDPVSSPTFVLVNVYRRSDDERLAHLDAYRLENSGEATALDLDQLMDNGPMVVEWAPRIKEALPKENLTIKLEWVEDEHRQMKFIANGKHYEDILASFQSAMMGAG